MLGRAARPAAGKRRGGDFRVGIPSQESAGRALGWLSGSGVCVSKLGSLFHGHDQNASSRFGLAGTGHRLLNVLLFPAHLGSPKTEAHVLGTCFSREMPAASRRRGIDRARLPSLLGVSQNGVLPVQSRDIRGLSSGASRTARCGTGMTALLQKQLRRRAMHATAWKPWEAPRASAVHHGQRWGARRTGFLGWLSPLIRSEQRTGLSVACWGVEALPHV